MKKISIFTVYLCILFIIISCGNSETNPVSDLKLAPKTLPFNVQNTGTTYYTNISYGSFERNVFDIILPGMEDPASLVLYIHGGGFTGSDKATIYPSEGFQQLVSYLLSRNIAVAAINYRFLEENETEGVLKPLNDSKRALQFIRHHSYVFNIDKNKVVLLGSSAGAGTSLWIGFNDDMAQPDSADDVLKNSTRVQGIVATETQSSYDIVGWPSSTFAEPNYQGLDFQAMIGLMTEETVLKFYGISDISELNSPGIQEDRKKLDMLALMTEDDPEFYLSNSNNLNIYPTTSDELLHHPLHSKALMDKSIETNTASIVYLPSMSIDTSGGESIADFIIRKIGN